MKWYSVYTTMDYWPELEQKQAVIHSAEEAAEAIKSGDCGFIFKGGQDVAASLYNEKPITSQTPETVSIRDMTECEIFHLAVANKIPMVGICRGAQFLCVMSGGSLIQDMNNHRNTEHLIYYEDKTIIGNSDHHQGMILSNSAVMVGESYESTYQHGGTGIQNQKVELVLPEVEFAYFPKHRAFGIQGHPEWVPGTAYERVCLHLIKRYLNA